VGQQAVEPVERLNRLNEAAGATDASRARLWKFCRAVRVESQILLSADLATAVKSLSYRRKSDSIPIAPHLPQPPASSFKRLYRTPEEHRALPPLLLENAHPIYST
jgi:hypothetical protein